MKKYFRHYIKNIITVKNIITIEYHELGEDFFYPEEQHDFWELVYVDKGSLYYRINGVLQTIEQNQVIFLKPGWQHGIEAMPAVPSNIFVICFDCASPAMAFFGGYKKKLGKDTRETQALLAKLVDEISNTYSLPFDKKLKPKKNTHIGGEQSVRVYLELLMISLLRHATHNKTTAPIMIGTDNFPSEIVNLITSYLQKNLYGSVSVQGICREFSYSKAYLSRIFKEETGQSLISYYNKLKIEEAKKILRTTAKPVKEISDELSFSDPRYFIYLFKKTTGTTPLRYRTSLKKIIE